MYQRRADRRRRARGLRRCPSLNAVVAPVRSRKASHAGPVSDATCSRGHAESAARLSNSANIAECRGALVWISKRLLLSGEFSQAPRGGSDSVASAKSFERGGRAGERGRIQESNTNPARAATMVQAVARRCRADGQDWLDRSSPEAYRPRPRPSSSSSTCDDATRTRRIFPTLFAIVPPPLGCAQRNDRRFALEKELAAGRALLGEGIAIVVRAVCGYRYRPRTAVRRRRRRAGRPREGPLPSGS